jgi:hypothetical protein
MRNLLALTLILLLSASASAKPEDISLGPYNVSFDLNTTMNYTIIPHSELEKDDKTSSFHIDIIFDNDTRALVGIENYSQWQYAGQPCTILKKLVLELDKTYLEGNVSERMIDGKMGEVVSTTYARSRDNKVLNSIMAEYWQDSKDVEGYDVPVGRAKVEILAIFPKNLSESLLNTLHIEISEQPAQLETMAVQESSITVRNQKADDPSGIVIIPEVISPVPTFVVILDNEGNVLGYKEVDGGVNKNVSVKLNYTPSTDILLATLNKKADVNLPGWHHPFTSFSDYQSSRFIDERVTRVGRKGAAWLEPDWRTTSGVYAGAVNPEYSREQCIAAYVANGYPESMAAFSCD